MDHNMTTEHIIKTAQTVQTCCMQLTVTICVMHLKKDQNLMKFKKSKKCALVKVYDVKVD